jgi:hypothetical protein
VHESVVTGCATARTRCQLSAYALWYFFFLYSCMSLLALGYYHLCNLLEKAKPTLQNANLSVLPGLKFELLPHSGVLIKDY